MRVVVESTLNVIVSVVFYKRGIVAESSPMEPVALRPSLPAEDVCYRAQEKTRTSLSERTG